MTNLICHCFDYTDADIELDIRENGISTIMEKILAEKWMGGCQCATKNPKGR
jgi:NAD(P)H-nitrite reductase large subunit